MKLKTIKKLIGLKFNEWADSITDPSVRKMVMENTIITGGSIVSLLMNEKVNDYDMYFRNYATTLAVARYYAAFFPGQINIEEMDDTGTFGDNAKSEKVRVSIRTTPGVTYRGDEEASDEFKETPKEFEPEYKPLFMSSNAVTLSDQVQIVIRFFGQPEEIHANYDFVHCTCFWKSWDGELVTPTKALTAMMTKELIYVGSKYPLCSLIRIRKFIGRGWSINAGQMLKIILQLNELDLMDVTVLQDQLVGVDSAYFAQLIEAIANVEEEKMNAAHVASIIDRIF